MSEPVGSAFISYSGDHDVLSEVVTALQHNGMRPWRDVENLPLGARTRAQILAELEGCRAAFIWLTEATLESEYVTRIELPAIFEVHEQRRLDVVPIFVSWEPGREASAAFRAASGREVGDFNGYVWQSALTVSDAADDLARRYAEAAISSLARVGGRPIVRCATRTDAAPNRDTAHVNLDWRREYPADGSLPGPSTVDRLRTSLGQVSNDVIDAFGAGEVNLSLRCHLHLALALGHAFRRPSGMIPTVLVDGDAWRAEMIDASSVPQMHRVDRAAGPADASRACLEISISRDVAPGVNAVIAADGTTFGSRVALSPPGGTGQRALADAATANGWAQQAAQLIGTLQSQPGVTDIDLYVAAPVQFAALLGWQLNVGGPIHLHHWAGNAGPYRHVWTLPQT